MKNSPLGRWYLSLDGNMKDGELTLKRKNWIFKARLKNEKSPPWKRVFVCVKGW